MIIDRGKPKDFDTDLCSNATLYMSRMLCLRIEIGLQIMKARILKQSSGREKEYWNTCGFKLGWERMLDVVRDFVVMSPNVLTVVEMLLICVGVWLLRFTAVVPTVCSEIFHGYIRPVQGAVGMISQIRPLPLPAQISSS